MPMRQAYQATGSCIRMHTHPDNGRTYGFLSIDGSDEQIYARSRAAESMAGRGDGCAAFVCHPSNGAV